MLKLPQERFLSPQTSRSNCFDVETWALNSQISTISRGRKQRVLLLGGNLENPEKHPAETRRSPPTGAMKRGVLGKVFGLQHPASRPRRQKYSHGSAFGTHRGTAEKGKCCRNPFQKPLPWATDSKRPETLAGFCPRGGDPAEAHSAQKSHYIHTFYSGAFLFDEISCNKLHKHLIGRRLYYVIYCQRHLCCLNARFHGFDLHFCCLQRKPIT